MQRMESIRRRKGSCACLLTIALITLSSTTNVLADSVTVLKQRPNGMTLDSQDPTSFTVMVATNTRSPSTLQLFVEEYPGDSGCDGSQHQTNGNVNFEIGAGRTEQRFTVPWLGGQLNQGFLRIGARLNNGAVSWAGDCFRFPSRFRPLPPPPQQQRPAPPHPPPPGGVSW
jgi:hypothetical protein